MATNALVPDCTKRRLSTLFVACGTTGLDKESSNVESRRAAILMLRARVHDEVGLLKSFEKLESSYFTGSTNNTVEVIGAPDSIQAECVEQ
jgi:hypothetical protein